MAAGRLGEMPSIRVRVRRRVLRCSSRRRSGRQMAANLSIAALYRRSHAGIRIRCSARGITHHQAPWLRWQRRCITGYQAGTLQCRCHGAAVAAWPGGCSSLVAVADVMLAPRRILESQLVTYYMHGSLGRGAVACAATKGYHGPA
jgi:hypothetical protein